MIYLRQARIHDDAELPAYVVKLALPFPMAFTTPITILTGENGKGKSTVLEALASAMGVDTDGGSRFKTQERTSPIPLALTKRNPPRYVLLSRRRAPEPRAFLRIDRQPPRR
ncbi:MULTISPECIES: AAA family ATPase [unclassified Corynebacterium]|uniref:AAA family ATPase n=1 Tax=unclassified Corynebacterium TaxID=2624378 RepID=UPI000A88EA58|nr:MULTISPECIES: AAA family ATPase [unclassified Corynebacterium]